MREREGEFVVQTRMAHQRAWVNHTTSSIAREARQMYAHLTSCGHVQHDQDYTVRLVERGEVVAERDTRSCHRRDIYCRRNR